MTLSLRVIAVVVLAAGSALALAAPASAGGCSKFIGTADGWDKADAVSGAQAALASAITEFKAKNKGGVLSVSGMRATPQPYWRSSVSADLYVKPDVVTSKSYTVCWHGVISPVVCTSGAKVCW
jgi:hypothetical protein